MITPFFIMPHFSSHLAHLHAQHGQRYRYVHKPDTGQNQVETGSRCDDHHTKIGRLSPDIAGRNQDVATHVGRSRPTYSASHS